MIIFTTIIYNETSSYLLDSKLDAYNDDLYLILLESFIKFSNAMQFRVGIIDTRARLSHQLVAYLRFFFLWEKGKRR